MKICKTCKKEKDLQAFYKDKQMPDGIRNNCKACKDAQVIEARRKNKEKWNAYMRKFRKEHPLSVKDKIHKTNRVMRCRYGMDLGLYDKMLSDQNDKCAICGVSRSILDKNLVVDHCHATGVVRGLLCFSCNRSIAILDNPDLLSKAQAYLAKYK